MTEKNYPEDIYPNRTRIGGEGDPLITDADIEKAYDLGLAHGSAQDAQPDSLAGFSNLTQAIQGGAKIDWECLDGRATKCVHERHGTVSTRLELQEDPSGLLVHTDLSEPDAWREEGEPLACLLDESWLGNFDWSLWIEGEIPVKTRTADQLEPGSLYAPSQVEVVEVLSDGSQDPKKEV